MKTSKKLFKTFFLTIILVTAISCSKDDNSIEIETHANGIVKLTESPVSIIKSTFSIDNGPKVEVPFTALSSINNDKYIELRSGDDIVFVSIDDQFFPTGETIFQISGEKTYAGKNFQVENNKEESDGNYEFRSAGNYIFRGQVINSSDDKDIKPLIVTIELTQLYAGDAEYTIEGEKAILTGGDLGNVTYNQILEINKNYPEVNTIQLGRITGSVNDEINVETGRLIRKAGYTTHLTSTSEIYSGGVDLFCSGKKRTREAGAKIGVHSWCCYKGKTADQLPKDSPGHDKQLAYFREMLGSDIGSDFYFFTINASPFNGMYLMKDNEISKYKLLTH